MSLIFSFYEIDDNPQRLIKPLIKKGSETAEKQLILVPEHIKFEAERDYIGSLSEQGSASFNTKVFSISRFLWYLLRYDDIYNFEIPSGITETLLLSQAINSVSEELTIYKNASQYPDFITKISEVMSELTSGNLTIDELISLDQDSKASHENILLQQKLQDISKIIKSYNALLPKNYCLRQRYQERAITLIKEVMRNTDVYISHFYRFNPEEIKLIMAMASHNDVTIYLTGDQKMVNDSNVSLFDPYDIPKRTYQTLLVEARKENIPLYHHFSSRTNREELQLAETWLKIFETTKEQKKRVNVSQDIHLVNYLNLEEEAIQVLKEIKGLVEEQGYRYKDILIATRQLSRYKLVLPKLLKEGQIPFLWDEPEKMADHPLVTLIESLKKITTTSWTRADLLVLLRNQFFSIPCDYPEISSEVTHTGSSTLNQSENLALKTDIIKAFESQVDYLDILLEGFGVDERHPLIVEDWVSEQEIRKMLIDLDDEAIKRLENFYKQVMNLISDIRQRFSKLMDMSQFATVLKKFLIDYGVVDQLNYWRDVAIEMNEIELSRHHEQVFKVLQDFMVEMVQYHTTEKELTVSYFDILLDLFSRTNYKLPPTRLDQLVVTTIDAVQYQPRKAIFIIGLTQDVLPLSPPVSSLFNESERDALASVMPNDKDLKPPFKQKIAAEPYILALVLKLAIERLHLSSFQFGEEGEEIKDSPYLTQIATAFEVAPVKARANYVSTSEVVNRYLGDMQFRQVFLTYLNRIGGYDHLISRIMSAFSWSNIPQKLPERIAQDLYGTNLHLSVSQLESFYKDPYNYFLKYGLKLQERPTYEPTVLEKGTLAHFMLDEFWKEIISGDLQLETREPKDLKAALSDVISRSIDNKAVNPAIIRRFNYNNYTAFMLERLKETISQVLFAQLELQQDLIPHDVMTETVFGDQHDKSFIAPKYSLSNGGVATLRGRIDRLERFFFQDKSYIYVSDYKSSGKKIDLTRIYDGVDLQLLIYLDVALKKFNQSQTLGMSYVSLKSRYIEHTYSTLSAEDQAKEFLKNRLNDFRAESMVLNETDVLCSIDHRLNIDNSSRVFKTKLKKNGELTKNSAVQSKESFDTLLAYANRLVVEAAERILKGDISLAPLEDTLVDTVKEGIYYPISLFDPSLPKNYYRPKSKDITIDHFKKL